MGVSKPCLGYPSRSAAVAAMRGEGKTTREIADAIGIEPKTVTALEKGNPALLAGPKLAPRSSSQAAMEDAIMALWEDNKSAEQIAAQLDLELSKVKRILYYMREGESDHRFGDKAVASQSAALLAAIRLHHPERCAQ